MKDTIITLIILVSILALAGYVVTKYIEHSVK